MRAWAERDKVRAVEVTSPLAPDECVRRLAQVTTTRREGWYLDPRTATLPHPVFHGTVEPSRVRIGLFPDMLGRSGHGDPVWFDVRVNPGPDGGTVLAGTAGSPTAQERAVFSLVFIAALAALALFFFVLGVVITAAGHFNPAVGAAIGVPVIGALAMLAARGDITLEGEGRVPPLLRRVCGLLDATSLTIASLSGCRSGRFGSAIGPLICSSIRRDPTDFPRFTPLAPANLGPL